MPQGTAAAAGKMERSWEVANARVGWTFGSFGCTFATWPGQPCPARPPHIKCLWKALKLTNPWAMGKANTVNTFKSHRAMSAGCLILATAISIPRAIVQACCRACYEPGYEGPGRLEGGAGRLRRVFAKCVVYLQFFSQRALHFLLVLLPGFLFQFFFPLFFFYYFVAFCSESHS